MTSKIWSVLMYVSLTVYGAVSDMEVYSKVGGELLFPVQAKFGTFKTILWKFNKDKVAEYDDDYGDEASYYSIYLGRTHLDRATAVLTIKGLQKRDEGIYTLQLNDNVVQTYTLSLIDAVVKPTITHSLEKENTYVLTCEGNITGAEPVTYSWRKDEAWETLGSKITVTKSDSNVDKYTCRLNNPVSEATSEPFGEKLFVTGGNNAGVGVGVAAAVVLLVAVGIAGCHRKTTGVWIPKKVNECFKTVDSEEGAAQPPVRGSEGVPLAGAAGPNGTHSPNDAEVGKDGEQ